MFEVPPTITHEFWNALAHIRNSLHYWGNNVELMLLLRCA